MELVLDREGATELVRLLIPVRGLNNVGEMIDWPRGTRERPHGWRAFLSWVEHRLSLHIGIRGCAAWGSSAANTVGLAP